MINQNLPFVRSFVAVSVVAGLSFAGAAQGAVTLTQTTDVAPSGGDVHEEYTPPFTVSSSDLAQGILGTGASNPMVEDSGGAATWTDGSITTVYKEDGTGGDAIDHAAYGAAADGDKITFDLGGLFNLSQIDVYVGWNDSGRDDLTFVLEVSSDNVSYSVLANHIGGPNNTGAIEEPITHRFRVLDDGGADIATGVRYVRLDIVEADNTYAGLTEVDVFGVIPEPASMALLALGGLVLGARPRRS